MLYFEVEKEELTDFSTLEREGLKEKLSIELQAGIEKVAHSLFMPRNEEEVMRNIITLSNQLRFFKDLPQAIISFDEQTESELSFTVIWLRILKPGDVPIEEVFGKSTCLLKIVLERIRQMGLIRKKFPKEASVFRVKIPIASFLRSDCSVDLFKARYFLVTELESVLGQFRDYNGGMIAKQHEQYLALKKRVWDRKDEWILENFFHSIFPIELRSVFPIEPLEILFKILLKSIAGEERCLTQIDDEYAFFSLAL